MSPRAAEHVEHTATGRMVFDVGSQHPSTHGLLRLAIETDGEEIVSAEACLGFLHRGIEKLGEHRRYHQLPTLMDRGDYLSGIHGELASALAVERLRGIEVPPKAHWLRSLLGEINRIASHMAWYGTFGRDAGVTSHFFYSMRDREALLDILEAVTGQRMTFNYVRPGGVIADLTVVAESKIRRFLRTFDAHLDEHQTFLGGNELLQKRLRGVGVIDRDSAMSLGLTGANLRASGVPYDVRRDRPYAAYSELEFGIPIGTTGDAMDRYLVRIEEMRQAARIVRQCIEGLPEGAVMAKLPKALRPREGETYACVESPRGELGVHLVADGSETPRRFHYRAPSLFAIAALEQMLPGTLLADAALLVGSVDIVPGEVER